MILDEAIETIDPPGVVTNPDMKEGWHERNELYIGTNPDLSTKILFTILKTSGLLGQVSFELNQDGIGGLKEELSTISPKEEKEMQALVSELNKQITNQYGKFIVPERVEKGKNLEKRVIFTDKANLDVVRDLWHSREGAEEEIAGFYTRSGDFIVFLNKGVIDEQELFEESIKHEIFHFYQNPFLPIELVEAGAYFYSGALDEASKIYGEYADRYGDLMHKIFFSDFSKNQDVLSKKIINDLKKELTDAKQDA